MVERAGRKRPRDVARADTSAATLALAAKARVEQGPAKEARAANGGNEAGEKRQAVPGAQEQAAVARAKKMKKKESGEAAKAVVADSNWKKLQSAGVIKRKKVNRHHAADEKRKAEAKKLDAEVSKFPVVDWAKRAAKPGRSRVVAIDCEMVGVGPKSESELAQICVVNEEGEVLYESYAKPRGTITDYRTKYSGIRPSDLVRAPDVFTVQTKVADIIRGKILVGHSLKNDLSVLMLKHPGSLLRDTAKYTPFKRPCTEIAGRLRTPKLRDLALQELGVRIQEGEHDPYIDARASLELYKKHRDVWEKTLTDMRLKRRTEREQTMRGNKRRAALRQPEAVEPSPVQVETKETRADALDPFARKQNKHRRRKV